MEYIPQDLVGLEKFWNVHKGNLLSEVVIGLIAK